MILKHANIYANFLENCHIYYNMSIFSIEKEVTVLNEIKQLSDILL